MKVAIASALFAVAAADVSSHVSSSHGHGPAVTHAVHQPHHAPAVHHAPVHHAPPVHHAAPVHHAPAYKPAPAYGHHEPSYDGPAVYQYAYEVNDDYTGTNFGAEEARDGYNTNGQYRVVLPDCRTQTVTYTVDEYGGYVADVQYDGYACEYHPEPKAAYHAAPVHHAPAYKPAPTYKPAPSYHA